MTGVLWGIEFFFAACEAGCGICLCDHLFERQEAFTARKRRVLWGALAAGLCVCRCVGRLFSAWEIGFLIAVSVLALSESYQGQRKQIAAAVLLLYDMLYLMELLGIILLCLMTGNSRIGPALGALSWDRAGFLVCCRVLFFWLLNQMAHQRELLQKVLADNTNLLLGVGLAGFYVLLRLQSVTAAPADGSWYLWREMGKLGMAVSVFLIWLLWNSCFGSQGERENRRWRQEMLLAEYEGMKAEKQKQDIRLHDMKHHVHALKGLYASGEMAELGRYLDELDADMVKMAASRVWTGNRVIDCILDWKVQEAQSQQIAIEIESELSAWPLEEKDICCVLANLLDNAIEASRKLPKEARRIRVKLKMKGNLLLIRVVNAIAEPPRQKRSQFLSAKRNYQKPGCGLASVRQIVERYQGTMEITFDEKEFRVETFWGLP